MIAEQLRSMAILLLILTGAVFFLFLSLSRFREQANQISKRLDKIEASLKVLRTGDGRRIRRAARAARLGRRTRREPAAPRPAAETAQPLPPQPTEPKTSVSGFKPSAAPEVVRERWSSPKITAPRSVEEELGTRWSVWVGGIALALGGLLLVRYTIEQGWFVPAARIASGAILAVVLIAAGEWLRRKEVRHVIAGIPAADVPAVLTAAGTAAAFGTAFAAHALYEFLGATSAFVVLGLISLLAMIGAYLHGPALAGLGLVGSYVTPLLVSSTRPSPWPIVIYLTLVTTSAMALARARCWLWLAFSSVLGAFFWGLLLGEKIGFASDNWVYATFTHTLVQLTLVAIFLAIEANLEAEDETSRIDIVATGALGIISLLMAVVIIATSYMPTGWTLFAGGGVGILVATAYRAAPAATASIMGGAAVLIVALVWRYVESPLIASHNLWPAVGAVLGVPQEIQTYLWTLAGLSLLVTSVTTLRLWRGPRLPIELTQPYVAGAVLTPLAVLSIVYLRVTQFDTSIRFALIGLLLAALFALLADGFQKRQNTPSSQLACGVFAAASIAAFSFALTVSLERGYLTAAFALSALGTAVVASRRHIPLLRHAVAGLGLLVLARVIWDPRIMGDEIGTVPIFNWLLVGYGVPAICFWSSARFLETGGRSGATGLADALAILFAGLLSFYEIHHALHDGDITVLEFTHVEQGLFAIVSIGFAHALMRMNVMRENFVHEAASYVAGGICGLVAVTQLGFASNPYFNADAVSGFPIVSSLAVAYLVPAVLVAVHAYFARQLRPPRYVTGALVVSALLVFAYVTLEVRHVFQGTFISLSLPTSAAEQWTYSAVWLLLGLILLAYGIWRKSYEARIASAVLVILSVLKVFLFDLHGLTGFWRAFSFIVLGLVLISIGLAYQNLIFRGPRPALSDGKADDIGGDS